MMADASALSWRRSRSLSWLPQRGSHSARQDGRVDIRPVLGAPTTTRGRVNEGISSSTTRGAACATTARSSQTELSSGTASVGASDATPARDVPIWAGESRPSCG